MSKLRSVLARHRAACAGLAMAVAAVVLVLCLPASSSALGKCGLEFYYYSDPGLTTQIGLRGYLPPECGCGSYGWGSISPYREIYDSVC